MLFLLLWLNGKDMAFGDWVGCDDHEKMCDYSHAYTIHGFSQTLPHLPHVKLWNVNPKKSLFVEMTFNQTRTFSKGQSAYSRHIITICRKCLSTCVCVYICYQVVQLKTKAKLKVLYFVIFETGSICVSVRSLLIFHWIHRRTINRHKHMHAFHMLASIKIVSKSNCTATIRSWNFSYTQ